MKKLTHEELTDLQRNLQSLWVSCEQALSGEWDKSDDGFEAMQWQLEHIAFKLGVVIN